MPIILTCHRGIGPVVTGTALVARDNFSTRYDLDRIKGTFSRPTHKLFGQTYVGKILVILDLSQPRQPREAGRWWLPGQKTPEEDARRDWAQQPDNLLFNQPVVRTADGKWTDIAVLEPVRDYKARHASTLLTFDAVVDAINQIEAERNANGTATTETLNNAKAG